MDYTERRVTWDRTNERLQYLQKPCINEANTKGRGFPFYWVFWALVGIAIISVARGW